MQKKSKLHVTFSGNTVVCAKSPEKCKECINQNNCETLILSYDPYRKADILYCFNNNEKRR